MELSLNLVWLVTGLYMLTVWLLQPQRKGISRGHQALCLGIAILLLFPVISLSDDLVAAQTAREADCCLRRAQDGRPILPHMDATQVGVTPQSVYVFRSPLQSEVLVLAAKDSFLHCDSIRLQFSRPPPVA
jgi:hypothetical protein